MVKQCPTAYYWKKGQTVKTTVTIKDFDGTICDPDSTPTCKVYYGGTVKETLSVSKDDTGIYSAMWSIPSDTDSGRYVLKWTWKVSTKDDLYSILFEVYECM